MGLKGFVEGGIASIVAGVATHPLDLIKVRMQLQGEGNQAVHSLRPALAFQTNSARSDPRAAAPPRRPACGAGLHGDADRAARRRRRPVLRRLRHRAPPDAVLHHPDGALRYNEEEMERPEYR
ncbi:hypothetical protein RHMOL_Rhmol10G0253500 [Rhododendron molle]|uniref:Uncharacterized protein n=1 Tax=Rhododendron molle TaxID=49168 RepID=A0ACC0M673_RHOML|nr:hypothetical protein RHMOL_Rhmol10G0253500 [Rhododendron molle]